MEEKYDNKDSQIKDLLESLRLSTSYIARDKAYKDLFDYIYDQVKQLQTELKTMQANASKEKDPKEFVARMDRVYENTARQQAFLEILEILKDKIGLLSKERTNFYNSHYVHHPTK